MSKKLIYLVSFVLVLSVAGNASADIVVHWTFEEGSGTTVFDLSGNGHDGTINGAPQWVEGRFGGALLYDGTGDSVVHSLVADQTWSAYTVALWTQPSVLGQDINSAMFSSHLPNDFGFQLDVDGSNPGQYRYRGVVGINTYGPVTTDWVHIAAVCDGVTTNIYYNGEVGVTFSGSDAVFNEFAVGLNRNAGNWYEGIIDDFRVYDHALSEAEIQDMMLSQGVAGMPLARRPSPEDGALYEQTWTNLSWTPGDWAVSHNLYFGTAFDDVNEGAEAAFVGNLATAKQVVGFPGFPAPEGLQPGTTYYWRVDEVNDANDLSPWKGNVWNFWIPPKKTYEHNPTDGAKFVFTDVELSWMGGFGAKLHYAYFGDNFDDVNSAVVGLPLADTTFTPSTLELDKVYYWRIDEFDGVNTHKGDVLSFRTLPEIPITDPNMICLWTLEEGSGTIVVDWSGQGHHGTFQDNPQWVDGYHGGGLQFDGANDFVLYALPQAQNFTNFTVALWVKAATVGQGEFMSPFSSHTPNSSGIQIDVDGTSPGYYRSNTNLAPGPAFGPVILEWIHLALVAEGTILQYYYNGTWANSYTYSTDELLFNEFIIGTSRNRVNHFDGTIDDLRVYDRALTQAEIQEAMRGDLLLAWDPKPSPASTLYIRDATPLSWSAGDNASQHDVYFGTDRSAVGDADASDTAGIYRGRQGVTIYTPPDVEWGGGPYYWRIDEYNTDATISKGNLWSFTITDFILIDDFEDYNDYPPDEIFSTWIDGYGIATNGSTAGYPDPNFDQGEHYVETTIVHGGGQSMPLFYENNFKYSEVTMTLVSARDWTEEGVGVFSLWFYGDASNAAERMYVTLNGSAVVYHDNPDAALIDEWTEWTIDPQEFAAQGVNLANVNTISIGFGDKNNLQAGGSGMVFFDDIRLYRPAEPEPEPLPPEPVP